MKLLAVVACVAFLYGVSSETADLAETPDIESFDDDRVDADILEWLNSQTADDWDEGHTVAWVYGWQQLTPNDWDSAIQMQTEGFSCSCSGASCQCSYSVRLLSKQFRFTLEVFYRSGRIGIAAKVNSRTIAEETWGLSRSSVQKCKRLYGIKCCAGLSDIRLGSSSVSLRGRIKVSALFLSKTFKTRTLTIRF